MFEGLYLCLSPQYVDPSALSEEASMSEVTRRHHQDHLKDSCLESCYLIYAVM